MATHRVSSALAMWCVPPGAAHAQSYDCGHDVRPTVRVYSDPQRSE